MAVSVGQPVQLGGFDGGAAVQVLEEIVVHDGVANHLLRPAQTDHRHHSLEPSAATAALQPSQPDTRKLICCRPLE